MVRNSIRKNPDFRALVFALGRGINRAEQCEPFRGIVADVAEVFERIKDGLLAAVQIVLVVSARIVDGRIAETRFLCRGCTTSIASASVLTEKLRGCSLAEARAITAESVSDVLGGLPLATFHGAQLAADAVRALLQSLSSTRG